MLVVIPSYNRIDRLRWTLTSLMQAEIPEDSRRFLCLANNDPTSQDAIEGLIAEIKANNDAADRWEWRLLNRERTLDPVDNWYSAIDEMAEENEVVFLHGDDDLFLPWGLMDSYRSIVSVDADMLLSESAHGLWFLEDGNSVAFPEPVPDRKDNELAELVDWGEILADERDWGPAFIGNHCYRYTKDFRRALTLSLEWCHKQSWLDRNTRTLMLPCYLPFAVLEVKGRLYGLRQTCVIRGRGLVECESAPFGVPGWNAGFLHVCAYGVFNSEPLKTKPELESARRQMACMAADWFLTYFFDKRISSRMRNETLRRIQMPRSLKLLLRTRHSVRPVLREILGSRNSEGRVLPSTHSQPAVQFLDALRGRGSTELVK